ncbi:MAG: hypothetical protein J0M19_03160 [Sphingomonadales bacterium]|nr:hypothetical protein [Sphingomonadales bacterium]
MQKLLISYLLITGVGTAVVMAMPSLVVLGFFLLIIPGLILSMLPSAFLYGLVFAAGWFAARMIFGDGVLPVLVGLAAVLAVGFTVPLPSRNAAMAAYRSSLLPEILPEQPIALRGVVHFKLNRPKLVKADRNKLAPGIGQSGFRCDGHCLAALFTPGVTAVVLDSSVAGDGSQQAVRTFRLEKRPGCSSNVEVDFKSIVPPLQNPDLKGMGNHEGGKLLVSQWAMKLAGEYCLVADSVVPAADFTVIERTSNSSTSSARWSFEPGRLETQTVEILAGDTVVSRQHQSSVFPLSKFLFVGSTGGIEHFRFGWNRTVVHSKTGYDAIKLSRILGQHTNLAGKPLNAAEQLAVMRPALRAQLIAALDDPSASAASPGFQVMESYFQAMGNSAADEDVALLVRLVSDQRLTEFRGAWQLKLPLAQARTVYDAYTRRLIATSAPAEMAKSHMGGLVKNLGAEAAGLIGPLQLQLLRDPDKRLAVPELVRALGFGSAKNAPMLLAMIKHHGGVVAEIHDQRSRRSIRTYDRQAERDRNIDMIIAAKNGLCLLGPQGSAVADELAAYLVSGALPQNLVDGHQMADWHVTLVRMGWPISRTIKPHNMSGTDGSYRRNIQMKVDRWKPDRC